MRLQAFGLALMVSFAAFRADAFAAAMVTFISATGTDAGTVCAATAPCRTMQYAVNQTLAGGEVHALNAGYFGSASITRSVKLLGVPGASLGVTSAGNVVTIAASAGVVEINNFVIEGLFGSGQPFISGIVSTSPTLTVKNCVIRNTTSYGIRINASTSGAALIEDTTVERTTGYAIYLSNIVNALDVVINRVTVTGAPLNGVYIGEHSNVRMVNSLIAQSAGSGIFMTFPTSFLSLQSSSVLANGQYGVSAYYANTAFSAGNNSLIDNGMGKVGGALNHLVELGQD